MWIFLVPLIFISYNMGIRLHVIMIMQLHNHIRSSGWGNEWNISTLHNIRLNMWSRNNGMRNQSSDWWANIQIQLTVLIYLVAEGVKIKQVWYVCLCFLLQHRVLTFTLAGIWYWMYEIEKKIVSFFVQYMAWLSKNYVLIASALVDSDISESHLSTSQHNQIKSKHIVAM